MKIAVDFDGTITAHPKELLAVMWALSYSDTDEVFILTACAGELPREERQAEAELRAERLGFRLYPVVWCETHEKIDYCVNHNVDILIDDVPFKNTKGVLQLIPNNITNIQGIV